MTGQNDRNASGNRVAPADRAKSGAREYGRAGLFGIATPPGNPTVEPEMRILLPEGSAMLVSRLVSQSGKLGQKLIDYSERLNETADSFANLALDALGFACTGSSYLVDPAGEQRRLDALEQRKGYPVVTAADAVRDALRSLGVGAIALISPYPDWLTAASRSHWERSGLRVTEILQLPSGPAEAHRIYELTTPAVLERAVDFDPKGADAILITGTGMPSLRTILALEPSGNLPILSSNLCLAWALAKICGQGEPGPESRLYGGWASRLAAA